MLQEVVLARRRSPPWAALARDFGQGRAIERERFVPDRPIVGFPAKVDRLIDAWNQHFAVDYFTCRARIADLSARNVASIGRSVNFSFEQRPAIVERASTTQFLLFFHDDDDFFAGDLFERVRDVPLDVDTHVFPLIRVNTDLLTFVRDGADSEFVWGRRKGFDFRFQSNNYGLSSRICSDDVLREMTDHVEASRYADERRFTERMYPYVVSATVKTPCSASVLPGVTDPKKFRREMLAFAERFARPELPPSYEWLKAPLESMAQLFRSAAEKRRHWL
jgi:hypothetical protein